MFINGGGGKSGRVLVTLVFVIYTSNAYSSDFSVKFNDADIKEFINTVSKSLNKTIIIDPKVQGLISVRSYERLDKEKYYQFFLNVLDVHGFTVLEMPNNILKVIPSKRAKSSAPPILMKDDIFNGDELINRIIPLKYISAKNVTPLLRQLNDNTDSGSVAHYEPTNSLLITGRAGTVKRLVEIISEFDREGESSVDMYKLAYASATEVTKLVTELLRPNVAGKQDTAQMVKVVADERTNSILISGDPASRKSAESMIKKLDKEQISHGNTKVIYLKYAKAGKLLDVLNGVSVSIKDEKKKVSHISNTIKKSMIKADDQTNSLIITASPNVMYDLEKVIEKLDIRRAQVLVEAIIVEAQDGEGINLGIQWDTKQKKVGGFISYNKSNLGNIQNGVTSIANGISGLTTGFYRGNWSGLFTALATNSSNEILATPSIVTLDNMDAEFSVGQEVPVLSSQQTTSTDKVYNTISRQSVGIMLKVKPQINKGDSVLLEIRQEVSSVAENSNVDKDNIGSTFNKRVVNNAVLVKSGETVVVGGLLDKKVSNVINKIPLLGDIPIIGNLFRQKKEKIEKRNLILFIKPTIIRESDDYLSTTSEKSKTFNEKNNDWNLCISENDMSSRCNGNNILFNLDKKTSKELISIINDMRDFYKK
ncbi:type II secretion system secretin GspD [Yersinia ruckeri]|uniref:type II secretion system secretin GspD n=1 Tax=Yersinia ruckeri TaxID=29486 RepID=UPI001392346C|nr:type II secretion system secretin GspD [Yersinia ruckeri]MCK8539337.1 type II secretion system secretin GspD [Yersinia ruckeri]MCK8571930.1 type II secretion system secretin GspD [Yersinia ruckeri]MCK8575497.1 type II secretion system secretin GspD [Yersinia ruckeri]MCK8578210.1 type II secretion system secretin GspD [Yersinia ruckeri]MCK8582080.1 type II secretion system secretin GspD [Yersinia ruckeri]